MPRKVELTDEHNEYINDIMNLISKYELNQRNVENIFKLKYKNVKVSHRVLIIQYKKNIQ